MFESLGAARDLVETQKAASQLPTVEATDPLSSIDADDAVVRRLIDAAAFPELLGHETAAAVRDTLDADCAVVFVSPPEGDLRLVAWTGGDAERARFSPCAPSAGRTAPGGSSRSRRDATSMGPGSSRFSRRGRSPILCAGECG